MHSTKRKPDSITSNFGYLPFIALVRALMEGTSIEGYIAAVDSPSNIYQTRKLSTSLVGRTDRLSGETQSRGRNRQ
jgi:hypothetical protein